MCYVNVNVLCAYCAMCYVPLLTHTHTHTQTHTRIDWKVPSNPIVPHLNTHTEGTIDDAEWDNIKAEIRSVRFSMEES